MSFFKFRWSRRVVLLGLIVLAGCASTVPPRLDTTTESCLSFTTAGKSEPGTLVALSGAESNCERAVVELWVHGVQDVFAASFDLVFDHSIARLESVSTEGSFLTADGIEVKTLQRDEGNQVVMGITRWQTDTGQDATGSLLLARLRFSRVAGGRGATQLEFVNASLLGSEMPPRPKPEVRWSGGTLELR